MAAFSADLISNIAASALDYNFQRGKVFKQSLEKRPLTDALFSKKGTFPGGKGDITIGVSGDFGGGNATVGSAKPWTQDKLIGYSNDDQVKFYNPANTMRVKFPWKELHIGMGYTYTEAKVDGISITDEFGKESQHSDRDVTMLANILEEKMFDLNENAARQFDDMFHKDAVAHPSLMFGIPDIILDAPGSATVGGIDGKVKSWWRNRARTAAMKTAVAAAGAPADLGNSGGDVVTSGVADGGKLLQELQKEYLQLIRYGGKPTHAFCGSDFLDALQKELRGNGIYTQTGFASGSKDISIAGVNFMGTEFVYDPGLDMAGKTKRCYWLDLNAIKLFAMENEWEKIHNPARPHDQFVVFKSITWTGQLTCKQLNSSLVIDIS